MPSRQPAAPKRENPFVSHCVELLAPLGTVRTKRMFGGWGLYVDELFVALIAMDRLYLKADAQTAPDFAAAGCEMFRYQMQGHSATMGYWTAPTDAMDAPHAMAPWGRLAIQAALRARAARAAPRTTAAKAAPRTTAAKAAPRTTAAKAAPRTTAAKAAPRTTATKAAPGKAAANATPAAPVRKPARASSPASPRSATKPRDRG